MTLSTQTYTFFESFHKNDSFLLLFLPLLLLLVVVVVGDGGGGGGGVSCGSVSGGCGSGCGCGGCYSDFVDACLLLPDSPQWRQ